MADGKIYWKKQQIAVLFGLTARRVEQLTADGILPTVKVEKQGRQYEFIPTIQRYVKHLQERATGRDAKKTVEDKESAKLDAEIRYKEAKADKAQLEADELKGKMHRADDVEALTTDLILSIRSDLLALPGRLAVDICRAKNPADASNIIREEIYHVLDNMTRYSYDPAKYKQRVIDRKGFAANDEDDIDDIDDDGDA